MSSVPSFAAIKRGTPVSIILKKDQRTNKLTNGIVQDILTRSDHHRGVKVRLSSGLIGRVRSLGQPQMSYNDRAGQQGYQPQHANNTSTYNRPQQYADQGIPQYSQAAAAYTPQQSNVRGPDTPARPSTRTLEDFVPQSERGEQVEYMQSYENSRAPTQEELDRETLGRQFPTVDGSVVAMIYGDCGGDMSSCREMLQALSED